MGGHGHARRRPRSAMLRQRCSRSTGPSSSSPRRSNTARSPPAGPSMASPGESGAGPRSSAETRQKLAWHLGRRPADGTQRPVRGARAGVSAALRPGAHSSRGGRNGPHHPARGWTRSPIDTANAAGRTASTCRPSTSARRWPRRSSNDDLVVGANPDEIKAHVVLTPVTAHPTEADSNTRRLSIA